MPEYERDPYRNPSLVHQADFCSACGELLEDGVVHECGHPPGSFCTQCGKQAGHKQVCYPDARRRRHISVEVVTKPVKRLPWLR